MLIWTKTATSDVANFINNSPQEYSKNTVKYFQQLKLFLNILNFLPNLGKQISYNNSNFKKILYKKHIIYYTLRNQNIYIISIRNYKNAKSFLCFNDCL